MNKDVRKLRQTEEPTAAQKQELAMRLEGTTLQVPAKLKDNDWHKMTITVLGSILSVSLDGKKIGKLDSPGIDHPSRNKFGFTVAGKNAVQFDNWKVSVSER